MDRPVIQEREELERAYDEIRMLVDDLEEMREAMSSRQLALAITRLEEASYWLRDRLGQMDGTDGTP